jgi:hypothetical protein
VYSRDTGRDKSRDGGDHIVQQGVFEVVLVELHIAAQHAHVLLLDLALHAFQDALALVDALLRRRCALERWSFETCTSERQVSQKNRGRGRCGGVRSRDGSVRERKRRALERDLLLLVERLELVLDVVKVAVPLEVVPEQVLPASTRSDSRRNIDGV